MANEPDDRPVSRPSDAPPSDHERGPDMVLIFKESADLGRRPDGARKRRTIVREVALEQHRVVIDGRKARRSTLELVLLRLRNMAMEGRNTRAAALLFRLLEKYEPAMINSDCGYIVAPADISPEEWIEEAKMKNALMEERGFTHRGQLEDYLSEQRKKAKLAGKG